jgi:hypothetical protein
MRITQDDWFYSRRRKFHFENAWPSQALRSNPAIENSIGHSSVTDLRDAVLLLNQVIYTRLIEISKGGGTLIPIFFQPQRDLVPTTIEPNLLGIKGKKR